MSMNKKRTAKSKSPAKASGIKVKAATTKEPDLAIAGRVVDSQRHTVAYLVEGKTYSKAQTFSVSKTRDLAAKGRIKGVRAVKNHVQALPGSRRLSELPTSVKKASR